MKIAMVASESNPLVKSGGLADVIYSLSRELVGMGHEVMILIPYYKGIDARLLKKPEYRGNYVFNMSWRDCCAEVFETNIDGIRFVLVKNDRYFGRDNLYGYFDDGERFAFFDMAVRGILTMLDFKPDIIHTHDWQAAMMPPRSFSALNSSRDWSFLTTSRGCCSRVS